ncbi:MAG TPA: rod shape-determining protein RodA [Candidatus Faeciplasma pullistercoris]|uniref:Rod shape-determining protein RodA n=1 Tax=Candidatus Faeciplasma pullistercoris TaxID=2840800 RepID=A0A9D1KKE4_9FIRM|nr:rod shape-determining protein RodA [Candidatus Faeciplasma pullistercoris]
MAKQVIKYVLAYLKRLDKSLILLTLVLCGLGTLLLYSLSVNSETQTITNAAVDSGTVRTQLMAICVGLGASLVLAGINYRWFAKLWYIYIPLTVGLTLLTFTGLGASGLAGADDRAWIDLGFMTIQPAEFMKLAVILSLSYHCYKTREFFNNPLNILLVCIHGGIPALLVMLQGDDGTAIVFVTIFIAIVIAAGLSWKYILGAAVISPIAFLLMWNFYLQPVHKNRILSIINPERYANSDLLYQTNHSIIAIGSGQLTGKGLFGGDYSYVPLCHNDFIFSYAGQTLGFIGCVGIVVLLALLCMRILFDGIRSSDELGRFICVGVFAYLITHCVLNIGMTVGVTPVIGIPLPFFSAGGSAILTATVSIGLVLSVRFHHSRYDSIFKNKA